MTDACFDEVFESKDGGSVVARRGCEVFFDVNGETVAGYTLASEDLANKKFMQFKKLLQKTGGKK